MLQMAPIPNRLLSKRHWLSRVAAMSSHRRLYTQQCKEKYEKETQTMLDFFPFGYGVSITPNNTKFKGSNREWEGCF